MACAVSPARRGTGGSVGLLSLAETRGLSERVADIISFRVGSSVISPSSDGELLLMVLLSTAVDVFLPF